MCPAALATGTRCLWLQSYDQPRLFLSMHCAGLPAWFRETTEFGKLVLDVLIPNRCCAIVCDKSVCVALSRTQAESGRAEKLLITSELPVLGIL